MAREIYIHRQGNSILADEVFFAWTSSNLNKMLKVVDLDTNPIDRHHLLQSIVDLCYKKRKEKKYNKLCSEYSELHIEELPILINALIESFGDLPDISTFKKYAILLTENNEYKKAIKICEQAIGYGLSDGTVSGFEGRIEKIKNKLTND